MIKIEKAKESMTSKRRIQKMFSHEKTDRVPIGYDANPNIHERLCCALGVSNHEDLLQALGVDERPIMPSYIGPPLFQQIENRIVDPLEGYVMRRVEHASGFYCDYCDFPLAEVSEETIASFPVPNPDLYDYSTAKEKAKVFENYGLYVANPGIGCVINCLGMLMGMEEALIRLYEKDEAVLTLIQRRTQSQLGMLERTLEATQGLIDFMWLGEDLGTQKTPMISQEMYRSVIRPIHQQFVELADAFHIPVLMHTCGSSSWAYEDFIQIGIKGVDTLQPEAVNMSPEYLVEHFGGRLAFRGCISTAGVVATGTEEQVRQEVKHTLSIMMPTRSYCLAPTHCLQDNTPTENAIALYQAAHDNGVY